MKKVIFAAVIVLLLSFGNLIAEGSDLKSAGFGYTDSFSGDSGYERYYGHFLINVSDNSGLNFYEMFTMNYDVSSSAQFPDERFGFENTLAIRDDDFYNMVNLKCFFVDDSVGYENFDLLAVSSFEFFGDSSKSVYAGMFYIDSFTLFGLLDYALPMPYLAFSYTSGVFTLQAGLPSRIGWYPSSFFYMNFEYFPERDIDVRLTLNFSSGFRMFFEYIMRSEKIFQDEDMASDEFLFNRYQEAGVTLDFGTRSFLRFYAYVGYRYQNYLHYGENSYDFHDSILLDEGWIMNFGAEMFF